MGDKRHNTSHLGAESTREHQKTTTLGQEILDTVFRHLNLLETSYFGLRYLDGSNQTHWLDPTKRVVKQLKGKLNKEEGGY
ncbi:hypothetical protein M8J77_021329 [Diaphorina citri]|nr:hypothetical protein M8J77_021329 [Diaphorina citri]